MPSLNCLVFGESHPVTMTGTRSAPTGCSAPCARAMGVRIHAAVTAQWIIAPSFLAAPRHEGTANRLVR